MGRQTDVFLYNNQNTLFALVEIKDSGLTRYLSNPTTQEAEKCISVDTKHLL